MSETALMLFKPEFKPEDRTRFLPLIRDSLREYGLSVMDECEVNGRNKKMDLFDRVYSRLLQNARQPLSGRTIGGYAYLKATPDITEEQLFREWISPDNPALRTGEDCYHLQKGDLNVLNPFCPYQRRLFTDSPVSVRLFLITKSGSRSWEEIKLLFQGAPVQAGANRSGIRAHLSRCGWYTPTTNGLHLSASEHDARRETHEVMSFFTGRR